MHVPDNYMSPSTCAVFWAAMLPVWALAVKKIKKEISIQKVPIIGILSAFSFLIMMFNIPLPGGTTGHAVGAALIAILIGPYAACISITVALFIQAMFFGDGGVLAFGVNCFNMAFVMPFSGYYLYRLLKNVFGGDDKANLISVFLASYISLNIAAFITAVQFGVQPLLFKDTSGLPIYAPYPLSISIPAMMIPHILVAGLVEAIVAVGVYSYLKKMSAELFYGDKPIKLRPVYAMLALIAVISPLGLLASGTAWGEWGNQELRKMLGYIPLGIEKGFSFNVMMPDYAHSVIGNGATAYIISAMLGMAIILVSFKLITSYIKK
jgi:cobalt/nickel transport system permease protein